MPDFISVVDDPTRARLGSTPLNGHYQFDDEGVAGGEDHARRQGRPQELPHGALAGEGLPDSNGHGRCSPGQKPCARQGT
jgi:predicted Zn-dependent protease